MNDGDATRQFECFCGNSRRHARSGQSENDRYSCDIVCNKLQSCGTHRCARICHDGDCGRCVFDPEIVDTCCCGKMGIGALGIERKSCTDPLPVCGNVCGKQLDCGQEGQAHRCGSTCHPGDCPTCPLSRQVSCRCGSTTKDIPCIEAVQYNADHPLPHGQHTCIRQCHPGDCVSDGEKCNQPCMRPKPSSGHPCATKCHADEDCPEEMCKFMVTVTCPCGHNRTTMACCDIDRPLISRAPTKLKPSTESAPGNSGENTGNRYKCLQCTEECDRIKRNRRFAAALEIQIGDVAGESGPPSYTDFLKEQAKDHPEVVLGVEKVFSDLVLAVEKSSEGGRNYSFAPSNRDHHRLIHEYAAYGNIDSFPSDATSSHYGRIQVFVRNLDGRVIALLLRTTDAVHLVKEKIEKRLGIPVGKQRLIYEGHTLDTGKCIADYGIVQYSTVNLNLSLKGGQDDIVNRAEVAAKAVSALVGAVVGFFSRTIRADPLVVLVVALLIALVTFIAVWTVLHSVLETVKEQLQKRRDIVDKLSKVEQPLKQLQQGMTNLQYDLSYCTPTETTKEPFGRVLRSVHDLSMQVAKLVSVHETTSRVERNEG